MERHAPHKAGLQSFKEGLNDRIVCCLTGNCEANAEKGSNDLSDQGSQFTSHEWREFLSDHNLEASMSRRGNTPTLAIPQSRRLISTNMMSKVSLSLGQNLGQII